MENTLPTYKFLIDENDPLMGVDFISLVKDPAIEENWMAFSNIRFDFNVQKDKKMLFGPLMIPEKRIYRNDSNMGEYNVFFTKEDIQLIVRKFSGNNFNNNINFEHLGIIIPATLIESFIIKEGMVIPGFENLPVGTWMGCVFIKDDNFWTNYVKTETVKGFSIEINGLLERQEYKKINSWEKIKEIVNSKLSDEEMIQKITEEFIIEPKSGETEVEFIGRCMSIETNSYDQDQAYAICKSKWDNK